MDNQGIESVKLFERRMSNEGQNPYIGSFIISDASLRMAAETGEKKVDNTSFFLLLSLRQYLVFAASMAVTASAALIFAQEKLVIIPASMILALCLLWLAAGRYFTRKFVATVEKSVSQRSPGYLSDFNILLSAPLGDVSGQLKARFTALMQLGDVFLSRIRDMNYKALFGDSYWRDRIITNYIYDLSGKPSDSEYAVELANKMKTALWFSDEQKQSVPSMPDALIEAGRATMEYNLRGREERE